MIFKTEHILPFAFVTSCFLVGCTGCDGDGSESRPASKNVEVTLLDEEEKREIVKSIEDSSAARAIAERLENQAQTAADASPEVQAKLKKQQEDFADRVSGSSWLDAGPEDFLTQYEAFIERMEASCDTTGLKEWERVVGRDPIVLGWKKSDSEFKSQSRELSKRRHRQKLACAADR